MHRQPAIFRILAMRKLPQRVTCMEGWRQDVRPHRYHGAQRKRLRQESIQSAISGFGSRIQGDTPCGNSGSTEVGHLPTSSHETPTAHSSRINCLRKTPGEIAPPATAAGALRGRRRRHSGARQRESSRCAFPAIRAMPVTPPSLACSTSSTRPGPSSPTQSGASPTNCPENGTDPETGVAKRLAASAPEFRTSEI